MTNHARLTFRRLDAVRRAVTAAVLLPVTAAAIIGCHSPEDGRAQGGGAGGDGGNYHGKPVPVPSKLDGTKPISNPFEPR